MESFPSAPSCRSKRSYRKTGVLSGAGASTLHEIQNSIRLLGRQSVFLKRRIMPNIEDIWNIQSEAQFLEMCLQVYGYQFKHNEVYRRFSLLLGKEPGNVHAIEELPFLPIESFKMNKVYCEPGSHERVYTSSSTTGMGLSRHYVKDLSLYRQSSMRAFRQFLKSEDQYCILSLLPSYLERQGSSLVEMASWLHEASGHMMSGFFLNDYEGLKNVLLQNEARGQKSILLGVSFALLDFADYFSYDLQHTQVIETGGMKGRRKEMIREELHSILKDAWGLETIGSEYGMTEMLTQAWSMAAGRFETPHWMKVLIREPEDPLSYRGCGRSGGINVIDLANVHSCSFLATSDLGRIQKDGTFEVLGRFDHSDIRGCSLMVS